MGAIAIRTEELGKRYQLGVRNVYPVAKDLLAIGLKRLLGRRDAHRREENSSFWALRDVTLTIQHGEILGVIGRNGAGKSTLLKILSRITEPTTGRAELYGRVGSLLEVGTGFHPDLTGRENIYFNGAILGMRRREVARRFDEIVAFAEVDRFLDTPIKHFSSGMWMRLAFSVAAHLDTDILVVDEVLAVGDAAFQRKCVGQLGKASQLGRTVLFVSHNMGAIRALCSRCVVLENGVVAVDGNVESAIARYTTGPSSLAPTQRNRAGTPGEGAVEVTGFVMRDGKGEPTIAMTPGSPMVIEVRLSFSERVESPKFWINVSSAHGALVVASMLLDGAESGQIEGAVAVRCEFRSLPLLPQTYTVSFGAVARDGTTVLVPAQELGCFSVVGRLADYGLTGARADTIAWDAAPVVLPYSWHLPNGRRVTVPGLTAE